jgi:hypothetical protein
MASFLPFDAMDYASLVLVWSVLWMEYRRYFKAKKRNTLPEDSCYGTC